MSLVHDLSPQDESIGILVGLIEGHHAIEMSPLGRGERWDKVLAALIHHFGAASLDYVDHDWINDEWAQGGYGADIPPVVMAFNGEALCEPAGRIHLAGTETATEALGYFEGVLQSGIRATEEVLADAGAPGCIVTLSETPSTRCAMAKARPANHPQEVRRTLCFALWLERICMNPLRQKTGAFAHRLRDAYGPVRSGNVD